MTKIVGIIIAVFTSAHLLVLLHWANGEDIRVRYGWLFHRWKLVVAIWVFLLLWLVLSWRYGF